MSLTSSSVRQSRRSRSERTRLLRTLGWRSIQIAVLVGLIYLLPVPLYLDGLSVVLLVWMGLQYARGEHELLSIRNLFLVGFILFELYSVATVASSGDFGQFALLHPLNTEHKFEVFSVIFLVVFLAAYECPIGLRGGVRRLSSAFAGGEAPRRKVLPLAVAMTAVAIVLRWAAKVDHGSIGHASLQISIAASAVACGLAAWSYKSGRRSTGSWLTLAVIVVVNIPIVILGEFSRRPLVALFGAVVWSLYYCRFRARRSVRTILKMVAMLTIPLVAVAVFTDLRHAGQTSVSVSTFFNKLTDSASSSGGVQTLATNLPTGSVTLWVEENYPSNFHARELQSLQYFFGVVVPRGIWHDKPKPLSSVIATEADLTGIDQAKDKVPVGIIGNAAAEGGIPADVIYAFLLAALFRIFDDAIARNPTDPFVVVAIGSSLGQILGLARGESSLFAAVFVGSVIVTRLALPAIERIRSLADPPPAASQRLR